MSDLDIPAPHKPIHNPMQPEWSRKLDEILEDGDDLTDWETDFIGDMEERRDQYPNWTPSTTQVDMVNRIHDQRV